MTSTCIITSAKKAVGKGMAKSHPCIIFTAVLHCQSSALANYGLVIGSAHISVVKICLDLGLYSLELSSKDTNEQQPLMGVLDVPLQLKIYWNCTSNSPTAPLKCNVLKQNILQLVLKCNEQ